jgi:hypothetical protein
LIGFPHPRDRKPWRERGLLFRIFAYAMMALSGLIIAVVVLVQFAPIEDQALVDVPTPLPTVPTPPAGDYRGGATACDLLYEVREAILDGELDDSQLRTRLDAIRLSATNSEPALLEASKQIVAGVDLDRVEAFLDAIGIMVDTCDAYGYNPP